LGSPFVEQRGEDGSAKGKFFEVTAKDG